MRRGAMSAAALAAVGVVLMAAAVSDAFLMPAPGGVGQVGE